MDANFLRKILMLFRSSLVSFLFYFIILGMLYPISITVFAKQYFPFLARGSILYVNNNPIGSVLIGQEFKSNKFFWGRGSYQYLDKQNIPLELRTVSASLIDPHISVEGAIFQAQRVATAQNLPLSYIKCIIKESVEDLSFGFMGVKKINVLKLNASLINSVKSCNNG